MLDQTRWWRSGCCSLRMGQMQTPNFTAHRVNVTTKVSSSKIKYIRYNKSSLFHFTHLSRLGRRRRMLMLPDIFRTVLIFQYYDQPSVMQAAWIISVHLEEAWLFETSPALGLLGVGGSKNTISQVVSHELEIAKHSFPVRLLYCPSNPTPVYPSPPHRPPHLQRYTAHSVSWQKAAFPPTWWRNLLEWKKEGERERWGGGGSANWSGHRYMTHIPSRSSPPIPPLCSDCHPKMFSQCFTIQSFLECTSGTCELDGKRGENVAETPRRSCVSELSRSRRRRPVPPAGGAAP